MYDVNRSNNMTDHDHEPLYLVLANQDISVIANDFSTPQSAIVDESPACLRTWKL